MFGLLIQIYVLAFAADPDTARIQAHLTTARDALRAHESSHLTAAQRDRRAAAIMRLEDYIARAEFPRRTDDVHPDELRPRFIDDRGVHCAVGFLIASSGDEPVARAVNAEHEYAYVREMRTPGLDTWATANGLTIAELAMIQPTYRRQPPAEEVRRRLVNGGDSIALACAKTATPVEKIPLQVSGGTQGTVVVTTTATDAFSKCFVAAASKLKIRDAPGGFHFDLVVTPASLQTILERVLTVIELTNAGCSPRPGAIAREATVTVTTGKGNFAIRVASLPDNAEVNACLEKYARDKMEKDFAALPMRMQATRAIQLASNMESKRLEPLLKMWAESYARDCKAVASFRLTVSAQPDDKDFVIAVASTNQPMGVCVTDKLRKQLRNALSVPRGFPDGTHQSYFRIDTPVAFSFDVGSN